MGTPSSLYNPDNQQIGNGLSQSDLNQPQQPQPANNSANAGPVKAGLRSVLAGILRSGAYGASQAMLKASGEETDAERATRLAATAHLNAQTDLITQQAAQMKNLMPLTLPDGTTIHVPQAFGGKILEAMVKGQYGVQGQQAAHRFMAIPNVGMIDTQAQGGPSLVPGSTPQAVMVTPEISQEYNIPAQLIGKSVPLQQFTGLERGGASQVVPVMGAQGPALVNKGTKQATSLGLGNPGVATASAGAKARAANTPFQTYDANGNLITTSAADAIASGSPAAQTQFSQQGPTAQTRTAGQFAGTLLPKIDLIKSEIDRLNQEGKIGPIQGRWNDFLAGKVGTADPDYAKLRTELSLFASGAARAHTSRTGIEAINYFRSLLTQPGASADQLKSQLEAVRPYLAGYKDAAKFVPPVRNGAPQSPVSSSSDPFAAFGGKKR